MSLTSTDFFKRAVGIITDEEEQNQETPEQIKAREEAEAKTKEEEASEAEKQRIADEEAASKEEEEKKAKEEEEAKKQAGEGGDDEKDPYSKWAEENEDALAQYYVEKRTDYTTMKPEKLIIKKLSEEYPELSEAEIKDLFEDEFGEAEKPIEITSEMDEDEVKMAEKHNKDVEKRSRKLNAEAKKAASTFEKRKESLEKPVFKVDVSTPKNDEAQKVTEEEYVAKQKADLEANMQAWETLVDEGVKPLEKFEYKGVTIELDQADNDAIYDAALGYVAQAGDAERFGDGKGGVKMKEFVEHVAKSVLLDKLIDAAAKDKKAEIARKATNLSSSHRSETSPEEGLSVQTVTNSLWSKMNGTK